MVPGADNVPGELVLGAQAIEIAEPPHPSNLEATAAVTSLDSTSAPTKRQPKKLLPLQTSFQHPSGAGPGRRVKAR